MPNLIKAMVTIIPMGEPEDGDWGGGRSGPSNGGRSDGEWTHVYEHKNGCTGWSRDRAGWMSHWAVLHGLGGSGGIGRAARAAGGMDEMLLSPGVFVSSCLGCSADRCCKTESLVDLAGIM